MTQVGAGGVLIARIQQFQRFVRDYNKLTPALRELVDQKLRDLLANPRPPGLRFEKLKGYHRPDKTAFIVEPQGAWTWTS